MIIDETSTKILPWRHQDGGQSAPSDASRRSTRVNFVAEKDECIGCIGGSEMYLTWDTPNPKPYDKFPC